MPDTPWIWFEREKLSPVTPSLTLTFNSPSQQLSYSLRSIIYAGGNRFTVRFRDQSDVVEARRPDCVRSPTAR
jgi:hypothetical protein